MESESFGCVYVATGDPIYTALAIRSAESLRNIHPDIKVDLYTDKYCANPVFDMCIVLEDSWLRSKIDALILSRFSKTLYIDADTFVVGDIESIFKLLERFDICAAHDQARNSTLAKVALELGSFESYPQFNAGVLGIKKSSQVDSFLKNWKDTLQAKCLSKDQPAFRELIWFSDLRVATLPPEYNILHLRLLDVFSAKHAVPKIIHSPKLHKVNNSNSGSFRTVLGLLGLVRFYKLCRNLHSHDDLLSRSLKGKHFYDSESRLERFLVLLVRFILKLRRSEG